MQYRAVEFIKSHLVRYISAIFKAAEKGKILFTDGTNQITFSRTPYAVKEASWVARETPAILVGSATGAYEEQTFAENRIYDESNEPNGQYRYSGGNLDLDVELSVRANTKEERDNIADILCIFLTHAAAKDYFSKQDIKLPRPPVLSGESEIMEPGIEYPIYATSVGVAVHSSWVEWEPLEARLIDVISDVLPEINLWYPPKK
jgi:hypothetical protein